MCGVFSNRKNMITILMSIELLLLSATCLASIYSVYVDDIVGQLLSIFITTVAGAESSIGLAILVCFYRLRGSISTSYVRLIKY